MYGLLEDLQTLSGRERKHPTNEGETYTVFAVGLLGRKRSFRLPTASGRSFLCHKSPQSSLLVSLQLQLRDPSPVPLRLMKPPERDTLSPKERAADPARGPAPDELRCAIPPLSTANQAV